MYSESQEGKSHTVMHRKAAKPKMKARHMLLRQSAEGIEVIGLGKGYPVNLYSNLGRTNPM
jgi:hypothetical protein